MKNRPVVLFDVDGILANFSASAADVVRKATGVKLHPDDITTWDVTDMFPNKEHKDKINKMFRRKGFCRSIRPYDGSHEALARISEFSDIFFATAHMIGSKTWIYERIEWLVEHFSVDPSNIVFTHKKFLVGGDVLIEDNAENAEAWLKSHPGGSTLLWDRPYNKKEGHGLTRVNNWDDVISHIYTHASVKL